VPDSLERISFPGYADTVLEPSAQLELQAPTLTADGFDGDHVKGRSVAETSPISAAAAALSA